MDRWEVRAHSHAGCEVISLPDKKRSGFHSFIEVSQPATSEGSSAAQARSQPESLI